MTINEHELIDGFSSSKENTLGLIINDSVIWNKEIEDTHMYHLKNKLDYYINYIKNKNYKSMFPKDDFGAFSIELRSEYKLPLNALIYIRKLEKELEPFNIEIPIKISGSGSC